MAITKKTVPQRKIIFWVSSLLPLVLIVLIAGCKGKEDYKKEIELKGIQYSRETFLKELSEGNT